MKRKLSLRDTHDAVLHWVLTNHYKMEPVEAQKATLSGSGEGGIDAYWLNAPKRQIYFLQLKTSDPLTKIQSFGPDALREIEEGVIKVSHGGRGRNALLRNAILDMQEATSKQYTIKLLTVVLGNPSPALTRRCEDLNAEFKTTYATGKKWHAEVVALKDLNIAFCEDLVGQKVGEVKIPLRDDEGKAVPYHFFGAADQSAVLEIDAVLLAKLVQEKKYAIIAGNLRYPLAGSKYNDGILQTLQDAGERQRFWFYNNGITMVCESFKHVPSDSGTPHFLVQHPQIVNGCQTAFTLKRILEEAGGEATLRGVKTHVRLIQLQKTDGVPLNGETIARFTNSQTAITERDLRSNDQVQVLLQKKFEKLGYFYERKKDEWKAVRGTGPRTRAGYSNGKLTNTDLAQASMVFWLGLPQEAKNEKGKIYSEGIGGHYRDIFDPTHPQALSAEDFLVPHHLQETIDSWSAAWRKNHPLKRRATPKQKVEHEVLKHGDLFLLAIVGAVVRQRYGLHYKVGGASPDHTQLRKLETRLDESNRAYDHDSQTDAMRRSVTALCREVHEQMVDYCRTVIGSDPDVNVRSIFVRKTTFGDQKFKRPFSDAWKSRSARRLPAL